MNNYAYILFVTVLFSSETINAQTYTATKGKLIVHAYGIVDTIIATSNKITCTVDERSSEVKFSSEISSLKFENDLILRNLSKTLIDIRRNPSILFSGKLINRSSRKLDNKKSVTIDGKFSINGISQALKDEIQIEKNIDGSVSAKLSTIIDLKNHGVTIPTILSDALSSIIHVELVVSLLPTQRNRRDG